MASSSAASILLSKPANKLGGKGQDPIPGILTISDVKVLWRPETAGAVGEEAFLLNDVQRQQQVKGKPFLRIVATSGKALGLGFHSEEDRDEVLELLKQRKGVGEASGGMGSAERRALFEANKDLEALYNQLVVTGILTEAEFWSKHGASGGRLASDAGGAPAKAGQRLGLSSVMHEVEKLHDGKTERVNIHLTSQDIQRIFRDKPEVNRAFIAYVPHSMAEETFWQKYFKLEYKQAARRRNIGGIREDNKDDKDDIFAPFREHVDEEETAMARSRLLIVDPTLDLFSEYVGARWAGGSRSMGADTSRSDEAIAPATAKLKSLANELNRHSFHVLDGPIGDAADDGSMSTVALAASLEAARKKHASVERDTPNDEEVAEQRALYKLRASSDLADLRGRREERTIPLSISDEMAFLRINRMDGGNLQAEGPEANGGARGAKRGDVAMEDASSFAVDPSALVPVPYNLPRPEKALEEFCAMDSERFVKEFGTAGLTAASVSPEEAMGGVMVEFFRLEALKTDELLRHFWSNKLAPSGGDTEKMLRLRKHLTEQRESYVWLTLYNTLHSDDSRTD